jgi:hypothetical protein
MKAFASFVLLSVIIISCAPTQKTSGTTSTASWFSNAPMASESDSTIYVIGVASASDSSFAVFQSTEFARAMIARHARTIINNQYKETSPGTDGVMKMNNQISALKKELNAKRIEVTSQDNIYTAYTEMELKKSRLKTEN